MRAALTFLNTCRGSFEEALYTCTVRYCDSECFQTLHAMLIRHDVICDNLCYNCSVSRKFYPISMLLYFNKNWKSLVSLSHSPHLSLSMFGGGSAHKKRNTNKTNVKLLMNEKRTRFVLTEFENKNAVNAIIQGLEHGELTEESQFLN